MMGIAPAARHRVLAFLAAGLIGGGLACHSPSAPSCTDQYGRGSTTPDYLEIKCSATDSNLQCRAVATNRPDLYVYCIVEFDVTQGATWTVGDGSVATSLGSGVFMAAAPGDTFVRADWQGIASALRPVSVFAGTPPLPTVEIFGSVWQAGQTPATSYIDGATIRILNGLVAGRTATSGVPPPLLPGYVGPFGGSGYYRLLGVPPGTYRLQITKDGYASQERDVTLDGTASPAVDFQLKPG